MAYHDDIAVAVHLSRESYAAVKHGLDGIALLGGDFQSVFLVRERSLAHGQREAVGSVAHAGEVDAEGFALVKESGGADAYLLGFGWGELDVGWGGCRQQCRQQGPCQCMLDVHIYKGRLLGVRVNGRGVECHCIRMPV